MFEAFTTLAALAQHTTKIKLGQMVTCAAYRNAGLLAKEAACVDVFSEGRLILGIGAGWYEREYQAYGFPFPRPGVRLQILEETVEVVKRLWTEETVTYQGKHLAFDGAYCDPKPLQRLPELWIGGGGEKVTLRIEARHADKTNWQTGIEGFRRKSQLLHGYCDEIGRDFDSIVRTHGPDCRIFESERDMQAWLGSSGGGSLWGGSPHDEYVRDNFVGTVDQVAEKVQEYVDAGCREFVLWFRDFPTSASLEAFAREVVPQIRS
jgi:alkanesulfonate monooxygenase SsuD/methylene tetrahydromethanopterin reductase-like flavin-dependent oxidoreductase (luciferase family)